MSSAGVRDMKVETPRHQVSDLEKTMEETKSEQVGTAPLTPQPLTPEEWALAERALQCFAPWSYPFAVRIKAELAAVDSNRERAAFLEKALDQALSAGVPPKLPRPHTIEDHRIFAEDEEEAQAALARAIQRDIPFGEDTVVYFGSDECDYPYNCPELAKYLRENDEKDVRP